MDTTGRSCREQQERIHQETWNYPNFLSLKAKLELAGGKFEKVVLLEKEPGNSTMVATENIAKGERIAYIPRSMQITKE